MSPVAYVPKTFTFGPIMVSLTQNITRAKLTVPTALVRNIANYRFFIGLSEYPRDGGITWEEVSNGVLYTFTTATGRFAWGRIVAVNDVLTVPDRSEEDNPIVLELVV